MYRKVIITVHICIVTVTIMYICIFLQGLMWVFFLLKYAKLSIFYILQTFATIDAVALRPCKIR